jgi:hypothetical protein
MLCHWDPAWGMPTLVEGPSNARVPLYDTVRMPWEQDPTSASISVLGLASAEYRDDGVACNNLRVRAADHLGPDNVPLAPEGPFPLPDDWQWEEWRRRQGNDDLVAYAVRIRHGEGGAAVFGDGGQAAAIDPRVKAPCARGIGCKAYPTNLGPRSYSTCAAIGCPELSRLSVAAGEAALAGVAAREKTIWPNPEGYCHCCGAPKINTEYQHDFECIYFKGTSQRD